MSERPLEAGAATEGRIASSSEATDTGITQNTISSDVPFRGVVRVSDAVQPRLEPITKGVLPPGYRIVSLPVYRLGGEWLEKARQALDGFRADNFAAWIAHEVSWDKNTGARVYMLENADREIVAMTIGKLVPPDSRNRVHFRLTYLEGRGAEAQHVLKGMQSLLDELKENTGAKDTGIWFGGRTQSDPIWNAIDPLLRRKFRLAKEGEPTSGDPITNTLLVKYLQARLGRYRIGQEAVRAEAADLDRELKLAIAEGDEHAVRGLRDRLEELQGPSRKYQRYADELKTLKEKLKSADSGADHP